MRNIFNHGRATASLNTLRAVKWRNWITFLQDHYLSSDALYWQSHKDSGPVHDFRLQLLSAPEAIDNAEVRRRSVKTQRHFSNLDNDTSFLFRLCCLIWVLPLAGWSLYVAVILNEWGQFIAQLVVWSRNTSLAAARLRCNHATGWIVFKYYEDRIMGDLPALIFYTIVSNPEYRYLYDDPKSKWIVGSVTGLWLLLISFWDELWFLCRFSWWRFQSSPASITDEGRAAYKDFAKQLENFQRHTQSADVSDAMNQQFLMTKRDGSRLLRTMRCFVPRQDVVPTPRYSIWPKAPIFIIAAALQGQALYACRNTPFFFAITLGWAIWIMARMSWCLIASYVSGDDMSDVFSNIVAGTIVLLPLTVSMALTDNAVLASVANRVLLCVLLVLFVNLFSNLVGNLCNTFAQRLTVRHRSPGAVSVQNA